MLKKNLIIIALISLGLIITTNAFGQRKHRSTKAKIQLNSNTAQTTNKQQYNPKEIGIDKVKNSGKPTSYIGETEKNLKTPRRNRRRKDQPKASK